MGSPFKVCVFVLIKGFLRREGGRLHCFKEAAEEEKFGVVTVLGSLRKTANFTNRAIS